MKNLRRKAMAILLSLAVVLVYMPCTVFAENQNNGNWYDDYYYTLDDTLNTINIMRYYGNSSEINVPASAVINDVEYDTVLSGCVFKDSRKTTSIAFEDGCRAKGSIAGLFMNAYSLDSVDMSGLDTSSATNMSYMFNSCYDLKSVDLSGLDTSKVTDMSYMFCDCYSVEELDVSGFNTAKVTDMGCMFDNCRTVAEIDVADFDMSEVTKSYNMFYNCESLESIDMNGMDMGENENMSFMFGCCSNVEEIDVADMDTSSAENMEYLFYDLEKVDTIDLSGLDTGNVTTMQAMFDGCSSVTSLDLSDFDTSNVTNMYGMFYGLDSIEELDLSSFDTSRVIDFGNMFKGCESLKSLDISSFVFGEDADTYGMLRYCEVETLTLSENSGFEMVHHDRVEPGCTEYGNEAYDEIEEIGYSTYRSIEPKGHTPLEAVQENIVPSTCQVKGHCDEVIYCKDCGEELSRTETELPLGSHTPLEAVQENVHPSTCQVKGSCDEVIYCRDCGEEISRTETELSLAGHSYSKVDTENIVPSGCTEGGQYDLVIYCDIGGEELSRTTILTGALGHNYVEGECTRCHAKAPALMTMAAVSAPVKAAAVLSGYNDVTVSWNGEAGSSYDVYYKKADADTWKVKKVKGSSVKFSNLASNTEYRFKVRKSGGSFAGIVTVTTLKKLAAPSAVKAGSKVKVSWKKAIAAEGYQISRSTKKTGTNIVWTGKTLKKEVKASKGKTYYYKVRCYKVVKGKKIYSPWSEAKRFIIK